ncbi:MAG: Hpt domain-containing protein [Acidobacteria bacterium]|nr:Hpt domain-containing protein [Acidobacteriota bacterium]
MNLEQQLISLNRAVALERVGGDEELLAEVAELFLDDCPNMMREIRTALASGDAKMLERAAHTLKGSVANFGAEPVFLASLALEMSGRQGKMDGTAERFSELEAHLRVLCEEMVSLRLPAR